MEMLIFLILMKFIGIYFIQSLVFILSIYALTATKIIWRKYILSSVILTGACTLIRQLPLNFGVHTILILLVVMLLSIKIINKPVYTAVKATLISTIILLSVELIAVWSVTLFDPEFFNRLSKEKTLNILDIIIIYINNSSDFTIGQTDFINTIIGFGVNILFFIAIFVIYLITTKNKKPQAH